MRQLGQLEMRQSRLDALVNANLGSKDDDLQSGRDMLSIVAELQAGREQQRSKSGPRRAGQTDHMFGIPDGSQGNGYHKRGRKPGRRTDFMNDPEVIPKRQKALMRQPTE